MGQQYNFKYSEQTPYANAWKLISEINQATGVHLDLGCGYGAISEKSASIYKYVGVDADEEAISCLKEKGLEAYCHVFGDKRADEKFIRSILNGRTLALVTALDVLEHVVDPRIIISPIHNILLENNAPLIISVPNISHSDISLKLMGGDFEYTKTGLLDETHVSFYTNARIKDIFKKNGYIQIAENDYHLGRSDQHFPNDNILISESTLINQYLKSIKSIIDPHNTVNQFIRAFLPLKLNNAETQPEQKPFLSVIMRTQGKRPEAFKEALLCLSAQVNTDFELLIMAHKVDVETLNYLHRTIEDTPMWLQRCTRIISVDYGNRTAPLSEGFDHSRGKYISVFDDDDIVFDNWVDTFYKLYKNSNGCVLHAYAVAQEWEVIKKEDAPNVLRASGSMDNIYCTDYNYLAQLTNNFCPIMSLAFPSYAYNKLGIHFDETLTTTEDWDFLLRTVSICGIVDSSNVTSIYRRWVNSDNAQTEHNTIEWRLNYEKIQLKAKQRYMLLPPKAATQLTSTLADYHALNSVPGQATSPPAYSLYFDTGKGFTEGKKISVPANLNESDVRLFFNNLAEYKSIKSIRFDPTEIQGVIVNKLKMTIWYGDNSYEILTIDKAISNGIKSENGLIFILPDPQLTFNLKGESEIKYLEITAEILTDIPNQVYQQVMNYFQKFRFAGNGDLIDANQINQEFSLYLDNGQGFSEELKLSKSINITDGDILIEYQDLNSFKEIKCLRFDPTEQQGIIINNVEITTYFSNNSSISHSMGDLSTNGITHNGLLIFPNPDPQIIIPMKRHSSLESVVIKLRFESTAKK